ncbi:hypothetical protein ACMHYB_42695 [Sorangium sp. So ce1128]
MNIGLEIFSTLHRLVQRAMASLPGAQRGSLLVRAGRRAQRLMVDQGLDLGDIVTRSTLDLGFSYALRKTGGRVVYRT